MTMLLILFNQHSLAWIPVSEPAPNLLLKIRSGEWLIPEDVAARFNVSSDMPLGALSAGDLVIAFPGQPLTGMLPGRVPVLTPEQGRLVRFVNLGLTNRQISIRLGRSPRWISYMLKRIRPLVSLPYRPRGPRRFW